jgi:glutaredoxin-like protein NrdH
MLTVYVKPACVQCDATKRKLDAEGISYRVADIMPKVDEFKASGHLSAPVVVTDWGVWSGYRPDLILQHKSRQAHPAGKH